MRTRPRRAALGLRGRIVGLVLFTTVATLAVAALALLGPLESRLRSSALKTLNNELGKNPATPFKAIELAAIATDPKARQALLAQQQVLASRVGGIVYVYGYPDTNGTGVVQLPPATPADRVIAADDPATDVRAAFRYGAKHGKLGIGTINGNEYAEFAVRFTTPALNSPGGRPQGQLYWVLAVRKSIAEIPGAVSAIRTAFLTAALAGLGLSLLLGIPLSGRLVGRLRRLRQAAVNLARGGPAAEVELPVDRARDEVGDLARTFATMQSQLQHQEQARRAFVATASHELRTPLASLDGMLELLDDDLRHGDPDLAEAGALLDRARAQSRRLGRLAADLLDLSRLDAEVKLRSEPVELGELSRAVLAEFDLGNGERGVDAVLAGAEEQVWALADPGSVARILRILLDNAVRHSPPRTEVRVDLRGGQQAELSVCDQGPGIAPEDRAIIFERFQRGRDTAGQAGFGLGLAIGRELAARMGGDLTLDEAYARGAKFTLTLPVAHQHEVPALTVS